jgi:hypothetical protein
MPKILTRLQYDVISYIIAVNEEGSRQYLLSKDLNGLLSTSLSIKQPDRCFIRNEDSTVDALMKKNILPRHVTWLV